jgi:hypothetical protein
MKIRLSVAAKKAEVMEPVHKCTVRVRREDNEDNESFLAGAEAA